MKRAILEPKSIEKSLFFCLVFRFVVFVFEMKELWTCLCKDEPWKRHF